MKTFSSFFLRSVSKPLKGAYTFIDKGFIFLEYHSSAEVVYAGGDLKAEIIFCSGGINNEVFFAEKLADKFHKDGEIGFAESATISGFRSALSYSTKLKKEDEGKSPWLMGNDVLSLEACYKEAGIKVTASDIHRADWISWFLSGMTYSHFIGLWKGISNNRFPRVKALEFGGFRVPDTFAYLTSKGISYKMISGYKWQEDCRIIFAVERVFKGKSATELSLGINKSCGPAFWNASYEVVATVGEGFDLVASCSFPISKDFSLNIGGGTYSTKSLLGERQAKNMKKGRSSDAFISMSYWY
ncbi:MAG: hypothetical protein LBF57_00890 [Holosporaceae bacterium]|jgi:hypothetical protein|nr:hypothetical protein [Holosporaceae bacterium]